MNWPIVNIGTICIPTSQRDPRQFPDEKFMYIDIASIDREQKMIVEPQILIGEEAPSRARKVVKTGDVLVSTVRPNLNTVTHVSEKFDNQIASTGFCILRADSKLIESRYLFYKTTTTEFVDFLVNRMRGANYPAVTDGVVKAASIILPPLSEQRRIVELLDQADALRRKRAKADAKAARILPALFIKLFGDPATNPRGWKKVTVSSVLLAEGGVRTGPFGSSLKKHEYTHQGIPVWGINNIAFDVFIEEGCLYVSEEKYRDLGNYTVNEGDIFISRAGTVGRMCVARPKQTPSIIGTNLIKLTLDQDKMLPEYFVTLFTHFATVMGTLRATGDEGAYSFMNPKILRTIEIPHPPVSLQQHFAKRVIALQHQREQSRQSRHNIDAVFQNLLRHAFTGDLTAGWREGHLRELLAEMELQARWLGPGGITVEGKDTGRTADLV